jgi:hypothetical protein
MRNHHRLDSFLDFKSSEIRLLLLIIKLHIHCWNNKLKYPESEEEKEKKRTLLLNTKLGQVETVFHDIIRKYTYHYRLEISNREQVLKVKISLKESTIFF